MSIKRKIKIQRVRRAKRVRSKLEGSSYMRVSIFRSLNHTYAQLIDDANHATLVSCSTLELEKLKGQKKDKAKAVGAELGKRMLAKGIDRAVFDRGGFLFHGRVKAVADGLREAGITI